MNQTLKPLLVVASSNVIVESGLEIICASCSMLSKGKFPKKKRNPANLELINTPKQRYEKLAPYLYPESAEYRP